MKETNNIVKEIKSENKRQGKLIENQDKVIKELVDNLEKERVKHKNENSSKDLEMKVKAEMKDWIGIVRELIEGCRYYSQEI